MPRLLETARESFWILALAVIVLFAFFVALGAFAPGRRDLGSRCSSSSCASLWIVHATLARRRRERDPSVVRARERRGF